MSRDVAEVDLPVGVSEEEARRLYNPISVRTQNPHVDKALRAELIRLRLGLGLQRVPGEIWQRVLHEGVNAVLDG